MSMKLLDILSQYTKLKIDTEIIPFLSSNISNLSPPCEVSDSSSDIDNESMRVEDEMNFNETFATNLELNES